MIKIVFLHMGYVESARLGSFVLMPFGHFDKRSDAIKSLANALFQKWKTDQFDYYNTYFCCGKSRDIDREKFCSSCGTSNTKCPREPEDFDSHLMKQFECWLSELPGQTIDGSGEELEEWSQWESVDSLLPLTNEEVIELYNPEPLFSAIVNNKCREAFVSRRNELDAWKKEATKTFDDLLEKY